MDSEVEAKEGADNRILGELVFSTNPRWQYAVVPTRTEGIFPVTVFKSDDYSVDEFCKWNLYLTRWKTPDISHGSTGFTPSTTLRKTLEATCETIADSPASECILQLFDRESYV
jgi:hypothetical protein